MSLNRYNPNTRYRARRAQSIANLLGVLAFLLIACLLGFWFGKQYAAQRNIALRDEVSALTQERDLLRQTVTEVTAEKQTAHVRYDQLKDEVNKTIPDGPMRYLVSLLRDQLSNGMNPERLSFAIRAARPPTDCKEAESKSFLVATPQYKGSNNKITLAEGEITIQGKGVSAKDSKGNPEAWYDPSKKVSITFKHGNKVETKRGVLPLQHSMVVAGREYRVTVEVGAKSYAKALFDSCAYP